MISSRAGIQTFRAPGIPGLLSGTPAGLIATLGVVLLTCAALVAEGWLPIIALRTTTVAVVHGGLISVALSWAATGHPRWDARGPSVITILILTAAAGGAAWDPRAAIIYMGSATWLAYLAIGGRLDQLGLRYEWPIAAIGLGFGAGLALAVHMLIAASATFGYHARTDAAVLAAFAYDVGANVPSSELFFRGALFNRLQRRWSLPAATTVATIAALVRYLADPTLPHAPEVIVGTLLYVSVLSIANSWLLWWSGSLLPGIVASLVFFATYRMVSTV